MNSKKCVELLNKSLVPIAQELNELDWKESLSNNNEKLAKHLSAFANFSGGGFLVYGINDDGDAVGVETKESKRISEILGNIARDALEPKIALEFLTFEYCGKIVLAVHIAESVQKPVHLKNKGFDFSFIRAGGQTRQMSQNEIRMAILSSRVQRYEELPAILPIDGQDDWMNLFDFSEIIKRTRAANIVDREALFEHLFQYKLLLKTRGKYLPTNLCVLTCALDFTRFPGYEKFGIRVTEYSGIDKISARRDLFFNRGYSLVLDEVVDDILSIIPYNEKIDKASRINDPLISKIIIRELLINAVVHRNYVINDSFISVNIFSDRVEITNPGGLLPDISIDRLIDHPSKTRNEVLADLMRKLRFAEEAGSGYDKAVNAIEIQGLPPIKWRQEQDYFCAIIYMPKKFSDMEKNEKIEAVFQHACLNYVINKKTNNHSIRQRFKFSDNASTKVYRLIKECIKEGRIKCVNKDDAIRRDWCYVPYWA